MRVRPDDNEKLKEFLELFIENLQKKGMLPGKLSAKEEQNVIDNLLKMLSKCFKSDELLHKQDFFKLDHSNEPTELTRFLFLAVKMEFLKELGCHPEFEAMNSEEEKALNKAIKKLQNATTEQEVEEAFEEVLNVCEKLKKNGLSDMAMMVTMLALQIKEEKEVLLENNNFHPIPAPSNQTNEGKDSLTDYLENLFGMDPRMGGGEKVVTVSVGDPLGIGAQFTRLDTQDKSQASREITEPLLEQLGEAISDGPICSLLDNLPPKPSPQ